MTLTEWAVTDEAAYAKRKDEIDAIILCALASGPKSSYELMILLRAEGVGNAADDRPLALSYSMTGAIYRSAKNSLRNRGLICDSWDVYTETGTKVPPCTILRRADMAFVSAPAPPPPQPEQMA
jgi:hypothetical protein